MMCTAFVFSFPKYGENKFTTLFSPVALFLSFYPCLLRYSLKYDACFFFSFFFLFLPLNSIQVLATYTVGCFFFYLPLKKKKEVY